jgi:protein-disulfide isomerase
MFPKDVKEVHMNFPLRNHKFARKAAEAAAAAGEQGKYWEYHDAVLENYNKLDDKKILEIAAGLKLDMAAFEKDAKSRKVRGLINRDIEEARKAGVRGTPTVFINGMLQRDRSVAGFKRSIEAELRRLEGK